ncbi:MAG: chemotaxis protein [Sulfurimonas sp.]|nr:chemotaxis protein [Sulfurimonas sp.]
MTEKILNTTINGDMNFSLDENLENNFGIKKDSIQKEIHTNSASLNYTKETDCQWPLPATDENKMVYQLDEVTKEGEIKASEIFDIIEGISNDLMREEKKVNEIIEVLGSNVELFTRLNHKFPDVNTFKTQLDNNNSVLNDTNEILETLQNSGDSIISVMDIMQFQDIHRQKIERVINVMRSLSNYMNNLLGSRTDDKTRASSTQHHVVNNLNNEFVSNEEIEMLLIQFQKKNS